MSSGARRAAAGTRRTAAPAAWSKRAKKAICVERPSSSSTGGPMLTPPRVKQTSRLERARLVLRNVVLGGGTASVLLYPEFVMRVANNVESAAAKVEERVGASRP